MSDIPLRFGVDTLLSQTQTALSLNRIGLVTNSAATAYNLAPSRLALQKAGVNLVALFAPEHGLSGHHADGAVVTDQLDSLTQLPVRSLYGDTLRPTAEMLSDIDVMLFDIPDVGVRFYTYIWTLSHVMEACAEAGIPVWVLDRPNPLGGNLTAAEGPVLIETEVSSFVGRWAMPVRHGLTAGELATYWNKERGLGVDLTVIQLEGWDKRGAWAQTGLPFVPASPGMPSYATVQVYPGTCLFEGTNVSEGRGTALPFLQIGAPWIDGSRLAERMNQLVADGVLEGAHFRGVDFMPTSSKYSGQHCSGIMVHVLDAHQYRPVAAGLHLVTAIMASYPDEFEFLPYPTNAAGLGYGHFDRLVGQLAIRQELGKLKARGSSEVTAQILKWTNVPEWAGSVRPILLYG